MKIEIEVVRNEDGTINVEETLSPVEIRLYALKEKEQALSTTINEAVNNVFDSYDRKGIPMGALVSLTMNQLAFDVSTFAEVEKAVKEHIRNSPLLKVKLGKGGGVFRKENENG